MHQIKITTFLEFYFILEYAYSCPPFSAYLAGTTGMEKRRPSSTLVFLPCDLFSSLLTRLSTTKALSEGLLPLKAVSRII